MATIHKLTKDGSTIFPATIADAVVHQDTGKTLTSMIKDYNVSELFPSEGIDGGNKYNLALAISVLGTHLTAAEKTGGISVTFISSTTGYPEEEYFLNKNTWSTNVADWGQRFEVGDVIADPSGSWTPSTAEAYVDQKVGVLNANLTQEVIARQSGDSNLQTQLNAEVATRSSLSAEVDTLEENVAYIGANDGSSLISDFDPQTDTVWKKPQVLSSAEKAQVQTNINVYGREQTYTKTEVNGLVDTPHQEYVTVSATSLTTDATDVLPASGQSADTIYRVANWDGSINSYDVTKYSEYAWDDVSTPAKYVFLCVKSQIDEVFDISVYNNNATYADLAAALSGNNVPSTLQRGGMSVKYVQTSDNKYVQYRLMSDSFNTTVANWQGADDEPTVNSDNLVKSGGLFKEILGLYILNNADVALNYYRTKDGIIVSLTNFFYSNPIEVEKGAIFTADNVSANSAQTNVALLSWVESDGTFVSKILNPNGAGTYTYTFDRNGFVSISGNKNDLSKFSIQHKAIKERVRDNEDSISGINKELHVSQYTLNNDNVTLNKYIGPDAHIHDLTDFFYSNPIAVFKGNIFTANAVSVHSAQTGVALLAWVESDGTPISKILNPNGAGTYTYTFPKDGFISISGNIGDISKFSVDSFSLKERLDYDETKIIKHDEELAEVNGRVDELENEIGVSTYTLVNADVTLNYYRTKDGIISSLIDFFYSNPIKVVKGCVFTANAVSVHSAQTNVALLAWVKSDNTFISKILNPNGAGTYTYTFETDGYVSISGNKGDIPKFSIQYPSQKERINGLEDEVIDLDGRVTDIENGMSADSNNRLIKLTNNPVEEIRYDCGLFAIFKTVGVIGDSLASGEMQGYHQDGTKYYADMYEFSWGQQLAKMTGVDVYNFSQGGQWAKAWMQGNTVRTWDANDENGGAHQNKKQCYLIGLAHNDYTHVNNGDYTAGIGTVADINDADYTQNADSYVGWYARIIQAVKSIEPRAYIFCITPSDHQYDDYSAKIRDIVSHFTGQRVYLIDLATYGFPRDASWRMMGNHMSAAGYLYHAYEIANYIDWIIRKNGDDFKYTSLVGTDIYDTDPNQ